MTQLSLSAAARRLLVDGVGSLERLDLLLFLHRQAARWWSAQALAGELDRPAEALEAHLDHLAARNLLDVLLFLDLVMLPTVDLSIYRAVTGAVSVMVLLLGLIWDSR